MSSTVHIQNNWVGGAGVLGPVTSWGTSFYAYDSVTYNIEKQVCPFADSIDYSAWTRHTVDTSSDIICHSIWPADFDNDGDIDLAGWQGGGNLLVFYRNDGNGTFTKMNSYPVMGASDWGFLSGADLNKDSLVDVVLPSGVASMNPPTGVVWYRNNGNFNFTRIVIDSSAFMCPYFCVETGDINKDGNIDVLASEALSTKIDIYLNNGTGSFSKTGSISDRAWRLRLDDLNGDGANDLIVVPYMSSSGIEVYLNNGSGSFSLATTLSGTPAADGMWSRDFDNDGIVDILGTNSDASNDKIYWFKNNGTGASYTRNTVYSAGGDNYFGDGAYAEDMDMDGLPDVVSGFHELGFLRQVNSTTFTPYTIDNYNPISSETHWLMPIKMKSGCIGGGLDIVVCRVGAFLWYENNMVKSYSTGWLESSILQLNGITKSPLWFGWETCLPETSLIAFYWRGDSVPGNITSQTWQGPIYAVNEIDSIQLPLNPCISLFQYKAQFLRASSTVDAPVLYKVWMSDTSCIAGVEESAKIGQQLKLQAIDGNILLTVNAPIEKATLSLYNIAGTLVQTVYSGKLAVKDYTFTPQLSAKGVYLAVLKWTGGTKTAKIVKYK